MKELKLSELDDNVEISKEESNSVYTVAELKQEILEFANEDYNIGQWFTITRKKWKPSAQWMVDSYIENEADQMYEDWDDRAQDCVHDTLISNIQTLLDEAFSSDYATEYWTYEKPVKIDILPKS